MIPLLLLPGMMCTGALFREQTAHFSAERVVQNAPLNDHRFVHTLAQHVLEQAPPTFALCGHSMGAIVAIEVLRQAPARVKGIALMNTNPLTEIPSVRQKRHPQIVKVRSGGLLEVMRDEINPHYLADEEDSNDILELCTDMAVELGRDVFLRQSLAMRDRPEQSKILRAIRVPTLILCGEYDKVSPLGRHQMMHQMVPGSTLAVVSDAGHLPVLEQPIESNRHIQAWLHACDSRIHADNLG